MKTITPTFSDSNERGVMLLGTYWYSNSRFARQQGLFWMELADYHVQGGFRLYQGIR